MNSPADRLRAGFDQRVDVRVEAALAARDEATAAQFREVRAELAGAQLAVERSSQFQADASREIDTRLRALEEAVVLLSERLADLPVGARPAEAE